MHQTPHRVRCSSATVIQTMVGIGTTRDLLVEMGTGAISWASRIQTIATLSTTEAEYVSAVSAGQEMIWLRNLLTEFGYQFDSASTLFIDNQSAISVANNPEHHGRMKHLDLRFYWLSGAWPNQG